MREIEIRDRSHRLPMSTVYPVSKVICSENTKFHQVDIVEIEGLGRALFLDGLIQSCQFDEFIYHKALVSPAMQAYPNPRTILIGGGGEGCTLREVLAFSTVRQVDVVDIDEEAVKLQKNLGYKDAVFEHPKASFHFLDINKFLEGNRKRYNVILLDLTTRPTQGGELMRLLQRTLTEGGILATHAGPASYLNYSIFKEIVKNLRQHFKYVLPYREYIPCFCADWGFVLASNSPISTEVCIPSRMILPPYIEI